MKQLFLCILFSSVIMSASAQSYNETVKIVASDRQVNDLFGYSVSVSGNYAVVGAYRYDYDVNGINYIQDAGAAYIFEKDVNGNWVEVKKITQTVRRANAGFGFSVSISGDNVIIGCYRDSYDDTESNSVTNAGSAYFYQRNVSGDWNLIRKVVPSVRVENSYFGRSACISGNYAIIGAPLEQVGTKTEAGAVYFFKLAGTWNETDRVLSSDLTTGDEFGISVSISGDQAVIGAEAQGRDVGGSNFMSAAGAAYFFINDGVGNWSQVQKVVASDRASLDWFGYTSDISGDYAIIGANGEDHDVSGGNTKAESGSAYIFEKSGTGVWSQVQKITAPVRAENDQFSYSVSISGNTALIGAPVEDHNVTEGDSVSNAGSAYLFKRSGTGVWNFSQKIVASDRAIADQFASSSCIDGDQLIIGAPAEDEDPFGSNTVNGAGSAYFFKSCFPSASTISVTSCESYVSPSGNYTWTASNTYLDTIPNVSGCDSVITINLVINHTTTGTDAITACNSYLWIDGITYTESNNTATYTIANGAANGCDSIVTLDLTVNSVDVSITNDEGSITANAEGATYQWLNCDDNFAVITGETNQQFVASSNGNYAVEITQNFCTDTSVCVNISGVGIDKNDPVSEILIYPNPCTGFFTVEFENIINYPVDLSVTDIAGNIIGKWDVNDCQYFVIDLFDKAKGVYFLNISINGEIITRKLIIQ